MNLKAGLFRLWIVASITWIALIAYGLYETIKHDKWRMVAMEGESELVVFLLNLAGSDSTVPALLWMVLGPSLVLGAGHVVAWVIRGFRSGATVS